MSEYLSYAQFLKDKQNFKRSGTKSGGEFNIYDTPSHKYFKILFYFGSVNNADLSSNADGLASGLLAPTWEIFNNNDQKTDFYNYNSAWAYLKMNDENERADKLEQFVTLLSNISTYSPWYFTSVSGIQEALERKPAEDGKMEIGESKKISITCLPDAFDNRITTLLDLYRDITWSWIQKKEIIPANLRKFDMAIYIFESNITGWHKDDEADYDSLDSPSWKPSYKMIEFHDCEINYNSIKSGWNELNNQTGFAPTYTIDISYNDCYEISHNELLLKTIGDVITTDTYQAVISDGINISMGESLPKLPNKFETEKASALKESAIKGPEISETTNKNSFLNKAIGQLEGHLKADLTHLLKRAVLGNIHTYSLTQIRDQINDAIQGNIIKTGMTVADYIKSGQQRAAMKIKKKPTGNIFKD